MKRLLVLFIIITAASLAAAQQTPAPRAKLRFPQPMAGKFFPSGWMGDGAEKGQQYLKLVRTPVELGGEQKIAMKFTYSCGLERWAGVYWQHPNGNWGQQPGMDLTGAREITFYAKGEVGDEVVEFKSGGMNGEKYKDAFEKTLGEIALPTAWKQYQIDLSDVDLSNVIGAFAWSAPCLDSRQLVFYIADLQFR